MYGPPGTGKTMFAKVLAVLLCVVYMYVHTYTHFFVCIFWLSSVLASLCLWVQHHEDDDSVLSVLGWKGANVLD